MANIYTLYIATGPTGTTRHNHRSLVPSARPSTLKLLDGTYRASGRPYTDREYVDCYRW